MVEGCRSKEQSDGNRMAEVPGWFRGGDSDYGAIGVIFGKYGRWRISSLWSVRER